MGRWARAWVGGHYWAVPGVVVLVSGLPGSGKSTIADAVAARMGAPVHRREDVRAELLGPTSAAQRRRIIEDGPSPDLHRASNERLLARVEPALNASEMAVLDLVCETPLRRQLRELSAAVGGSLLEVECECAPEARLQRLRNRGGADWFISNERVTSWYRSPTDGVALVVDTTTEPLRSAVERIECAVEAFP